jgi:hypothetical protein
MFAGTCTSYLATHSVALFEFANIDPRAAKLRAGWLILMQRIETNNQQEMLTRVSQLDLRR